MDSEPHDIRASDADRQKVVDLLRRHTRDGRLTLDEFSDRVGEVYAARTMGELRHAMRELPVEPQRRPGRSRRPAVRRPPGRSALAERMTFGFDIMRKVALVLVVLFVAGMVLAMWPFLLLFWFFAIRPRHRGPGSWGHWHASHWRGPRGCRYRYSN
jgi:hypothetical protein